MLRLDLILLLLLPCAAFGGLEGVHFESLPLDTSGYVDRAMESGHLVELGEDGAVLMVQERDREPSDWYVVYLRNRYARPILPTMLTLFQGPVRGDRRPRPRIATNLAELVDAGFPENSLALIRRGNALRLITARNVVHGRVTRDGVFLNCSDCGRRVHEAMRDCTQCTHCLLHDPNEVKLRPRSRVLHRGRPWGTSTRPPRPGEFLED